MTQKILSLRLIGGATRLTAGILILAYIAQHATTLMQLPYETGHIRQNAQLISAYVVTILPAGFYLMALVSAGEVFSHMEKSGAFTASIVKGLKGTGENLMWGALTAVVLAPTLVPVLEGRFRGIRWDMQIESITIGLIGLLLWLITRQGQSLKTEMDSFV